ncbi:9644_t:CDS:2, partial [Acaulospora morrowiae]
IEILTRDTKSHKIDGVLKVFQTKKFTQTIIIMEFSYGQYASEDKDTDDQVKLSCNAKRILNKLLDKVPCEKARVYTIQSVNGNISIKYMVRPLPSIYLYEEFVSIKIPMTFDDMEEFAKSMQTLMDFQNNQPINNNQTNMVGYGSPIFNGHPGEDPEDWLREFRRYVVASRINITPGVGGVAGRAEALGLAI